MKGAIWEKGQDPAEKTDSTSDLFRGFSLPVSQRVTSRKLSVPWRASLCSTPQDRKKAGTSRKHTAQVRAPKVPSSASLLPSARELKTLYQHSFHFTSGAACDFGCPNKEENFLRFLDFPSNYTSLCPFSGPLLPSRAHLERALEALKRRPLHLP